MRSAASPAVPAWAIQMPSGRPLVLAAVFYYWAYQYLRVLLPDPATSQAAYLLATAPISMLAAYGLARWASRSVESAGMPRLKPLLAFVILVGIGSVLRGDLPTLLSAGLLALTLAWMGSEPTDLSLDTLNWLFVGSVVAGGVFHLLGLSDYGLLPGQYTEGLDRGIEWRVSLFPFVPESGFLALIVLLANQVLGSGRSRIAFMAAALYFLVLSGVRSAVIALLLCEVYVLVVAHWPSSRRGTRGALLGLLTVLFLVSVAGSSILLLVPGISEGPVGSFLFREAAGDLSADSIDQSVYRSWLWGKHVEVFLSSPLFGAGTYDFADATFDPALGPSAGTGSESFITLWLSRVGLTLVPFLIYLSDLGRKAAGGRSPLDGALFLVFCIAAFAYGSFLVPYNLVFLVTFGYLLRSKDARPDAKEP